MVWKSNYCKFRLEYDSPWEIIDCFSDNHDKIMVGVVDKADNASLIVKITPDVSKNQVSDEQYYEALKKQMIGSNPRNQLLFEGELGFKGQKFKRFIFSTNIKYGDFVSNIYIYRGGDKFTSIQFSYPNNLIGDYIPPVPDKIQKILNDMQVW